MNRNIKILSLISIVVLLLLVVYGFYHYFIATNGQDKNTITETTPPPSNISTFTDPNNTFSFEYNPSFSVTAGDGQPTIDWRMNSNNLNGILLAKVSVPKEYIPNTNFSDARLTIGMSGDNQALKTCFAKDQNETVGGQEMIGGYPFAKFTANDAGAGNFYETTSYRAILGQYCYVVEYTIHSSNIGNYSPDQGITEFDKTKIQNELENIVTSFKFLTSGN
jgi:hypothetical protein